MKKLIIGLKDIIIDPKSPADLTTLSMADAIDKIRTSYGFLGSELQIQIDNGTVAITLDDVGEKKIEEVKEGTVKFLTQQS